MRLVATRLDSAVLEHSVMAESSAEPLWSSLKVAWSEHSSLTQPHGCELEPLGCSPQLALDTSGDDQTRAPAPLCRSHVLAATRAPLEAAATPVLFPIDQCLTPVLRLPRICPAALENLLMQPRMLSSFPWSPLTLPHWGEEGRLEGRECWRPPGEHAGTR